MDEGELRDLEKKIEKQEARMKERSFLHKFMMYLVLIGVVLGAVYWLGYWPDFMRLLHQFAEKMTEAWEIIKNGAQQLQKTIK